MADDAAAPDGELSETSAADEQSGAVDPESTAVQEPTGSDIDKPDKADKADKTDWADTNDEADQADTADETDEADEAVDTETEKPTGPLLSHVRVAMIAGLVLVLALAGLTGWLGFRAYESYKADEQRKLFLQVGRQGALNLTTIDWQHADADVQRVLDSATGTFYDDFQARAQPFIDVVKQAQSKSVGDVTAAGLESESGDEAKVLVAVTVQTSNTGAPEQQPRAWRMLLTVQKVGDEAKVADVDFVP